MTKYIVKCIDEVDSEDINICNMYRSSTKDIFEISYKGNKNLLISSTTLTVPWNKTQSNDETSFNLELNEYIKACKGKESGFLCKLNNLINVVKERIEGSKIYKKQSLSQNMTFISGIKQHQNNTKSIRFFNVRKIDISIFNHKKFFLNIDDIKQNDNVKCLLLLDNCWMKENVYGVNIRLLQILREAPLAGLLNRCLIEHDDTTDDMQMYSNIQTLQPYKIVPTSKSISMPPPIPPPFPNKSTNHNRIFCPTTKDLASAKSLLKKVNN